MKKRDFYRTAISSQDSPGTRAAKLAFQDAIAKTSEVAGRAVVPIQISHHDHLHDTFRYAQRPRVSAEGFHLEDVLSDFVKMMKAADIIDGKQQDKMLRYLRSAEVKGVPTGRWSKRWR